MEEVWDQEKMIRNGGRGHRRQMWVETAKNPEVCWEASILPSMVLFHPHQMEWEFLCGGRITAPSPPPPQPQAAHALIPGTWGYLMLLVQDAQRPLQKS